MQYYSVYEQGYEGKLIWIMDVQAVSARQALQDWHEKFGDNYGKVVILPMLYKSTSYAFEHGED